MARGQTIDSVGAGGALRLSSHETAARVRVFLERWRREGGPAIEGVDAACDGEAVAELLPELPSWASSAGVLAAADRSCVLLWLESVDMAGEMPAGIQLRSGLQAAFRRPPWWTSRSVTIHYYVIPPSPRKEETFLSGVEQYRGDLVVLSPPAPGEILIRISESP